MKERKQGGCAKCDTPLLEGLEGVLLDQWGDYIGGQWTLQRPTRPGIYNVATREGHPVGLRRLDLIDGELVDKLQGHSDPGWCGYWWSHPLPDPPKEVPN